MIFSRLISFLFHPLTITFWVFLLYVTVNKYAFGGGSATIYGIKIFVNALLMPFISIILIWKIEFIPDLKMKLKEERIIPYVAVMVFYIWTCAVVSKSEEPFPILYQMFVIGITISLALSFVSNNFVRISVHMAGLGAVLMWLFLFSFLANADIAHLLILIILLTGFMGVARIRIENHSLTELYYGLLTGFIGQMAAFVVFNARGTWMS